jgi:hypothetical protein
VSFEDDQGASATAPAVSWSDNTIRVQVPAGMTSGQATATVTFRVGGTQSGSFRVDPIYTGTWNGNRVSLSLEGTGTPSGQTQNDLTGFYTNNPDYTCLNQAALPVKDASGSSNPEAYGKCGQLSGEWTIS